MKQKTNLETFNELKTKFNFVPKNQNGYDILVDFDGTCVTHSFPEVGKTLPHVVTVLKILANNGHNIILWTMRADTKENDYLSQAVQWFFDNDIPLHAAQINPSQVDWTTSPKAYSQFLIDDTSVGVPLVRNKHPRPYVDWVKIHDLLILQGVIPQ